MKIGEALTLRSVQARKLSDLRQRITRNVLIQEGENPSEDPNTLLTEYERLSDDYASLVDRISKTNVKHRDDLLVPFQKREHLRRVKNSLEEAVNSASAPLNRYMRSELRYIASIDVPTVQAKIDEHSETIRQLDASIQEANWRIDLED